MLIMQHVGNFQSIELIRKLTCCGEFALGKFALDEFGTHYKNFLPLTRHLGFYEINEFLYLYLSINFPST